jgi:hypothetical protein
MVDLLNERADNGEMHAKGKNCQGRNGFVPHDTLLHQFG